MRVDHVPAALSRCCGDDVMMCVAGVAPR
eukprot:COSAG01_NODE_49754_length_369_cov_0.944444_2_plen_29_part_01